MTDYTLQSVGFGTELDRGRISLVSYDLAQPTAGRPIQVAVAFTLGALDDRQVVQGPRLFVRWCEIARARLRQPTSLTLRTMVVLSSDFRVEAQRVLLEGLTVATVDVSAVANGDPHPLVRVRLLATKATLVVRTLDDNGRVVSEKSAVIQGV